MGSGIRSQEKRLGGTAMQTIKKKTKLKLNTRIYDVSSLNITKCLRFLFYFILQTNLLHSVLQLLNKKIDL